MKKILFAAVLIAVPSLSHAATNLVTNGSFEDPLQTSNTWSIPVVPGWTVFSGPGIEIRNNVAGAAQDGSNFVELDSNNNTVMFQTITTVAGQYYDLSFWYSPRESVSLESNPINVSWDGGTVTTVTATGIGNSGNVWTHYGFSVQATAASTVLQFSAVGTNDSYGGSLDNVSVSAVPEPETYAMFLAGLGLMGFMARRRSKTS